MRYIDRRMRGFLLLTVLVFTTTAAVCQQTNDGLGIEANNKKAPAFLSVQSNWADSVFKSLTPEERIAQLFMVAAYSNKDQAHVDGIAKLVEEYKIGGLIFFQGGPVRQARLTNMYQKKAKTPLFIALDAEWGIGMRLDSTISYPRQMTLGAIQDEKVIYEMGEQVALQCKELGIHMNFAPVIDVNNNANNPVINNRSFGEQREQVAKLGMAYMKGMQDHQVIACGKHFPGHGDTDKDSHKALPIIPHDISRLDSIELYPFKQLIDQGLASIMVAHLFIPQLDNTENLASTLSPKIVTDLLKNKLGYEGLIITDALNMKGVSAFYKPGLVDVKALLAGNDILLFPEDVPTGIAMIQEAITNGEITQEEVDERCLKILKAKEWSGLNNYQPIETEGLWERMNKVEYRALNKQLAKKALTVIKNDAALPIKELDTVKTVYLNIGGVSNNAFYETIRKYHDIPMIQVPRSLSAVDEGNLIQECADYERIVIGFHRTNNNPKRNFGITRQSVLIHNLLAGSHEVITVLFGNPYALDEFGDLKDTEGFVVAYQDNENTNEAAAQLIYGGITANGELPVSGSAYFQSGDGIPITERIRLAHVLPEEVGISSKTLEGIDKICKKSIRMKAFPGCQVVAIKSGNVIYNKAFGHHTYDKKNKVKTDDIYDVASITKIAATTASLIKLQAEGKVDIDNPLTYYLPQFVDSTRYQKMIIRQMLAHQAGLHPWIPFYTKTLTDGKLNWSIYSKDSTAGREKVADGIFIDAAYDTVMIQRIVQKPLRSKTYKYSDLGYYFIKAIIEQQTGQSLDEYVMEHFYRPMGLSTMGYHPLYRFSDDRIPPTEDDKIFRQQLVHGDVHDPGAAMQGGVGGHAGLFSSAMDLGTMMYMMINDGNYGGQNYLNKDTLADFTKCQYCPRNRRGAGFDKPVRSLSGGPTCSQVSLSSFGHQGFTGAITWADPENEIVYVFLSNRVYPDAENWLLVSENVRTEIQDVIYNAAK